jgi:hypothetical protein
MGIVKNRYNQLVAVEYDFKTINNVNDPCELEIGEYTRLENVDITNKNGIKTRVGYSVVNTDSTHSGWSDGKRGFVVKDNVLCTSAGQAITTLSNAMFCNFCSCGDYIAFSNGTDIGFIDSSNQAIAPPNSTTQHKISVPAGQQLTYTNGRLYIARENLILCSDAFNPMQSDERLYVVAVMDDRVTMLEAIDAGLCVGTTSEVILFQGSDAASGFEQKTLADYGVIENTACEASPETLGVYFSTPQGVCFVDQAGSFKNLTYQTFRPAFGNIGAGFLKKSNGMVHYLANTDLLYQALNVAAVPNLETDSL